MKVIILIIIAVIKLSGIAKAQQWVQTGSTPDGAGVTDLIITPQGTMLVTTASWSSLSGFLGGVRRSTNDGNSWENVLEGYNGRTLCLGDNGVVFASFWPYPLEEAVYRSTNDGLNWTRLHSVNPGDNIFAITSKDNNNTIFIGTRNGVKRSTNAGVNWAYVNSGIPANSWVKDIETDTSSGIVVVATTKGLFSTTNNGASWQQASGFGQDTIASIVFEYNLNSSDNVQDIRALLASNDGRVYESFRKARYLTLVLINALGPGDEDPKLIRGVFRKRKQKLVWC